MIESSPDGITITVRIIPRARTSGIGGVREGALLVRVQAPPVEGAANEALIEVIARVLDVPKRAVSIVAGARSRQKRVRVASVDPEFAAALISKAAERG